MIGHYCIFDHNSQLTGIVALSVTEHSRLEELLKPMGWHLVLRVHVDSKYSPNDPNRGMVPIPWGIVHDPETKVCKVRCGLTEHDSRCQHLDH